MKETALHDLLHVHANHGGEGPRFKEVEKMVALKTEYFLEDSQRVTKKTFIKWVQMKNKGLTSRELLREFEKKFDQLSTGEQQSLRSEKVELFVQAADSRLQKILVQLLEDPAGELGLTNDWDAVPAAINLLVKRQKRIDKSIMVDSHEDFEENGIVEKIVEKPKASSSPTLEGKEKPKAAQSSTLDDSTMDDLIKANQTCYNLGAIGSSGYHGHHQAEHNIETSITQVPVGEVLAGSSSYGDASFWKQFEDLVPAQPGASNQFHHSHAGFAHELDVAPSLSLVGHRSTQAPSTSMQAGGNMRAGQAVTRQAIEIRVEGADLRSLCDGYFWRKYGEKNIKNKKHPRSYFKCAEAGCDVTKHSERCSENSNDVIVTYHGKHNHVAQHL
ncbi:hypothetical protein L7F22_065885 [Adiantum nelumboides]|nr:hypothetical protein [Adiantum nelumboides]